MALRSGTILGERYRVVRELGHGGFGEVYLVEHVKLGTRFAAKVLSGPSMRDPHVRAQFQEEAKTAAGVAGRHVVKVQDVGEDPEHGPFFIMEFLEGRSLLDELRAQPEGYLSHSAVRGVFAQLRRALGKAHKQGVVHRDLKPENVFLARDEDDDEAVVKLLDFGLAKVLHEHASADLSRAMGTPTFAAPEQLRSQSGKVNTYTDVWALGLLAYLCLTGKHYWHSANIARPRVGDLLAEVLFDALEAASARAAQQSVADRLPQGFDAWFARCVDRDGGRRFAQAEACIDGLLVALGAPVTEARPSTPGPVSMRTGEGFASMDFGASQPPVSPPSIAPKPPQSSGTSTSPGVTEAVSAALDTAVVGKPKRGAVGVMAAGAAAMLVVGGYAFSRPSRVVSQPDGIVATIAAPSTPAPVQPGPAPVQPAQPASPPPASSCPAGMVRIPAGSFLMGSAEGEGEADERPQWRVTMSSYCMDRTEVTVSDYRACVSTGRCTPPFTTVNWSGYSAEDARFWSQFCNAARSNVDTHPINCVDWTQSDAYCRRRGARLPTEAEWEYAARGSDGRRYPWGNEAPGPSLLNAIGSEANRGLSPLGRTFNARMYEGDDGFPFTAPVGNYPAGASPFGLLDMAGNVSEWTADWYGNYNSSLVSNAAGPQSGEYRVYRGGGWSGDDPAWVRAAFRSRHSPSDRSDYVGFRCARGAL